MSFGFSVGDFLDVLRIARSVYQACKDGPKEYREIASEAKSIQFVLNCLCEDAKNPNSLLNAKGVDRKDELMELVNNCKTTMEIFQVLVDKRSVLKDDSKGGVKRIWHAYRTGNANLDSVRGKFTLHANCIQCFLHSLEGPSLVRIEQKINDIYARMLQDDAKEDAKSSISYRSTTSMVSVLSQIDTNEEDAWALIKKELLAENISMVQLMTHKDTIIEYVKSLIKCDVTSTVIAKPAQDEITPFIARDNIQESSLYRIAALSVFDIATYQKPRPARGLQTVNFDVAIYEAHCKDGIYKNGPFTKRLVSMFSFNLSLVPRGNLLYLHDYVLHILNAKYAFLTSGNVTFSEVAYVTPKNDNIHAFWTVFVRKPIDQLRASVQVLREPSHLHSESCSQRPEECGTLELRVGFMIVHDGSPFTLSLRSTSNEEGVELPIVPTRDSWPFEFAYSNLEANLQAYLPASAV